jgi:hypothetical protein
LLCPLLLLLRTRAGVAAAALLLWQLLLKPIW